MEPEEKQPKNEENGAEEEKAEPVKKEISVNEISIPKRKRGQQKFKVKRRKIKEIGAPKMPLTGYVRFMNYRKESIRADFPNKQLKDYIKLIGDEWNNLPAEKKHVYLEEAEVDKARYNRELEEFFVSRPDILAEELARNKNSKKTASTQQSSNTPSAPSQQTTEKEQKPKSEKVSKVEKPTTSTSSTCTSKSQTPESIPAPSIPLIPKLSHKDIINVFTDEFLEHNKCVDSELRSLRKSNTDYEMQNSILEKHVENMKLGVEKLHIDNADLLERNKILENYLQALKAKLSQALSDQGANADNLQQYLTDLQKPTANSKPKEIIRKLDLSVKT